MNSKIVLFCAFALSVKIYSQNNSKDKEMIYDIKDPRNPQCPCHVYQKMADKEFEEEKKKEVMDKTSVKDKARVNIAKSKETQRQFVISRSRNFFRFSKAKHSTHKGKKRRRQLFGIDIAACFVW